MEVWGALPCFGYDDGEENEVDDVGGGGGYW